mmetsp:Transcript_23862/g.73053  ORF Transcript_23862/g.73053 Transcript_23862/m.73053 type:complete len:99 (-) Transcript_23862:458-754(-)|eukprot:scaffold84601_cov24-Tisochrysis_lutea.AAC.1
MGITLPAASVVYSLPRMDVRSSSSLRWSSRSSAALRAADSSAGVMSVWESRDLSWGRVRDLATGGPCFSGRDGMESFPLLFRDVTPRREDVETRDPPN